MELKVRSLYRYLRIEIENDSDTPLDIAGVTAYTMPTYLVFQPAKQPRFELFAGNAAAPAPRYESSKMLASLDTDTLAKCAPVDLTERPGTKPAAKPKGQGLVWAVLAAAVLFTAGIFWNTARNMGKQAC